MRRLRRTQQYPPRSRGRRKSDALRFLVTDWRNLLVLIAACLAAALFVTAISIATQREKTHKDNQAFLNETRKKDKSIDELKVQIKALTAVIDALKNDQSADRAELARLEAQRDALQQQIILQFHSQPVVRSEPTTTTTHPGSPPPSSTTSTSTTTTTTTRCTVQVLGVCRIS